MMPSPAPSVGVQPSWVHPDLLRQLAERRKHVQLERVRAIEDDGHIIGEHARRADMTLRRKRARVEELEKDLMELRDAVAQLDKESSEAHQLASIAQVQAIYQRSNMEEAARCGIARADSEESAASAFNTAMGVTATAQVAHAEADETAQCALRVCATAAFDLCLPAPADMRPESVESIREFLKSFAPLFSWNEQANCVPPPPLFDEPCLLERDEGREPCGSAACAYWHCDELGHLRASVAQLAALTRPICARDEVLCAASRLFADLRRHVQRSTAIDQLCCGVAYNLNRIAALGWHAQLLQAASQPLPPGKGWRTPLAESPAHRTTNWMASDEERDAWEVALSTIRHGARAADVFGVSPSALTWRCVEKLLGSTPEKRRWLANTGRCLFPSSPHLQLSHVLALAEDADAASPAALVDACLEAACTLSEQASAAALTQADTVYCATTARYIASMIAVCAAHTARTNALQAARLLNAALGTDASAEGCPGAVMLLPIARQNLLLLQAALQQTGSLHRADELPLAAISDAVFSLSENAGKRDTAAVVRQLKRQLTLLDDCQRDALDDGVLGAMRAAVHLSWMQTAADSTSGAEAILKIAGPQTSLAQAMLWLPFTRAACYADGIPASLQLSVELLQRSAEHHTCLLPLLLSWHLRSHGVSVDTKTSAAAADFLRRHGLQAPDVVCGASDEATRGGALLPRRPAGVSAVEWVAGLILVCEEQVSDAARQAEWTSRVPLECATGDAGGSEDAVVLLLMAHTRASARAGSLDVFVRGLTRYLGFLAAAHQQYWSSLDWWSERLIGIAHWAGLALYASLPLALGAQSAEQTMQWRTAVLQVASHLGVLHPLLRGPEGLPPAA